jgi:hypothetical protein
LPRLREVFGSVKTIIYTTTCSTFDHPRWRIIVFLDRPYLPDEYLSIWRFFNKMLDGDLDKNTKDASRISFMPKTWRGMLPRSHNGERGTNAKPINFNFYSNYAGIYMIIDHMLMQFPVEPIVYTQTRQATAIANVAGLAIAPNIEIIQDWMWRREAGKSAGGRMYRVLQRAARRFKANGWYLSPNDLARDFMARANPNISPNDPRHNIAHDATNAIAWALANVETKPDTFNIFRWNL